MIQKEMLYIGKELEAYSHARNWKQYVFSRLRPHLKGAVLEVGAGIGSNTGFFSDADCSSWTCVEPDSRLAKVIPSGDNRSIVHGTIYDLEPGSLFDSIIYIDVLEHIEEDAAELVKARTFLKSGGTLIVLCPAHQWLYSPMDAAIGHFRRYNRASMLAAAKDAGLRLEVMEYLDSVGVAASLVNRFLLRETNPTVQQIQIWDTYMVQMSQTIDRWLGYKFGKSILGIWSKP